MVTLKDGSKTKDVRNDRIVQFDERSRKYPVRATIKIKKRRSYTWRCRAYLDQVKRHLETCDADIIGISAGFDNHQQDWGTVLLTDDYETMGKMVKKAAARNKGGCFAILEGGYNHDILGQNVMALIHGMSST